VVTKYRQSVRFFYLLRYTVFKDLRLLFDKGSEKMSAIMNSIAGKNLKGTHGFVLLGCALFLIGLRMEWTVLDFLKSEEEG